MPTRSALPHPPAADPTAWAPQALLDLVGAVAGDPAAWRPPSDSTPAVATGRVCRRPTTPGCGCSPLSPMERRFDPTSDARLPQASADLRVVVVCSEGCTFSLAAAALQDVGARGATDLAGGVAAWRAAGLPLVPGGTPAGRSAATRCSSRDRPAPHAAIRAGAPVGCHG